MAINNKQIKAARMLLDWSQDDLAQKSGIALPTINKIERDISVPRRNTIEMIQSTLERNGVQFTEGSGVRLKSDLLTILEGDEGIQTFFDDIYLFASNNKEISPILVYGSNEEVFAKNIDVKSFNSHRERMNLLLGLDMRVLISYDDNNSLAAGYVTYRKLPKNYFETVPMYIYGNKMAILLFKEDSQSKVVLLSDEDTVSAFRKQFEMIWEQGQK